ncbi:hypothetical protein Q8F55_004386 [Vanrija albida]|uniref:Template-activating factor I n=1 Tax=Vanrija albida TaxID=181172 RepID=A0ABR3Q6K5_9TREE
MPSEITVTELPAELALELHNASKDKQIRVERFETAENLKHLNFVREKVKDIKNFWLIVLLSHPHVGAASASDREALSYLTDIELKQDSNDPRPFELIFTFAENPYFTNKTLSKKYTLREGLSAAPADGTITEELRDFDAELDLVVSADKIDWKEGKDLVAKQPRKLGNADLDVDEDAEIEGDIGSFFHFFSEEGDPFQFGFQVVEELLPNASDLYLGGDDEDELDDDEDEDDEDDEGSIDLEDDDEDKPPKKKQRN